jgi:transcriptional regulator with XRE-family HTH domain
VKLLRENIRKIRELRNYTQEYMADQLGLSVSGYGKIERSDSDINLSRITQIAEILDVSRAVLLEFNSDEILTHLQNEKATKTDQLKVQSKNTSHQNGISDDDISTLMDIIRSLKEENKLLKAKLKRYEPDNEHLS